jgi:glycosyltransferase involved in cell wall biosynthesis
VHEVTGSHRERVERFAEARASFQSSGRFAFVYSESSTMPTLLTEPDHRPRWPLVDYALFLWARRNRIPLYLFYRDLHWRFEHYRSAVPPLKRVVAKSFYYLDLWVYRRVLDRLLLPTLEMAKALPFEFPRVAALPPGHAALAGARPTRNGERLRLVYVGGTGPLYRYDALLEAVSRRADVELFLCTRAREFGRYGPKRLPENVRLLHASGRELAAIYRACDVACIVVDPSPYWTLTRPVKLYEALGHGLPLLVTEGLGFSRWVEDGGLGWSVPYEAAAIDARLARLARAPELVQAAAARARREAPHHTWKARAQQVLDMNAHDVDPDGRAG